MVWLAILLRKRGMTPPVLESTQGFDRGWEDGLYEDVALSRAYITKIPLHELQICRKTWHPSSMVQLRTWKERGDVRRGFPQNCCSQNTYLCIWLGHLFLFLLLSEMFSGRTLIEHPSLAKEIRLSYPEQTNKLQPRKWISLRLLGELLFGALQSTRYGC